MIKEQSLKMNLFDLTLKDLPVIVPFFRFVGVSVSF